MRLTNLLSLSLQNARRHPLRSLLAALSVAAGIAVLMTITPGCASVSAGTTTGREPPGGTASPRGLSVTAKVPSGGLQIPGLLLVSRTRGTGEKTGTTALLFRGRTDRADSVPLPLADPDLSPVSREVAYDDVVRTDWPPSSTHIWKAKLDGSGKANLTARAGVGGVNCVPRWSPDGTMIAFQHAEPKAGQEPCRAGFRIWVMDAKGAAARPVTQEAADTGKSHRWPCWTPEGTRLFYHSRGGLVSVRLDGRDLRPETTLEGDFDLSPDGTRIVGLRTMRERVDGRNATRRQLVVVDVDGRRDEVLVQQLVKAADLGAHVERMTDREIAEASDIAGTLGPSRPRWSPDGKQIAFLAALPFDPEGPPYRQQVQVWICDLTTKKLTRVTDDRHEHNWISWR